VCTAETSAYEWKVTVNTCLCAAILVLLLVIGGVEQNPGPGVEGESFMQVSCS
jgi:hypothetical protein